MRHSHMLMLKGSRESLIIAQKVMDSGSQSEGSSKGDRQFAGSGRRKLVGTKRLRLSRRRRTKVNATQRIVVVPCYDGNDRRCLGFLVRQNLTVWSSPGESAVA